MVKITAVVSDEEFARLFANTFEEHDEYIHKGAHAKEEYELEIIIEHEHEKIRQLHIESDVVVSRGYTVEILRQMELQIPIVELPVTGNDIVRSISACRSLYPDKSPIVMGMKNVIFQCEGLSDIFGYHVQPVFLTEQTDAEIHKLLELMVNARENVIIGTKKVCEYAAAQGISSVMIRSGSIAIWQTISEAKRVADISRIEQEKTIRYKSVLDCSAEGILVVDKDGTISIMNPACEKLLGITAKDALGRRVKEVFEGSNIPLFFV